MGRRGALEHQVFLRCFRGVSAVLPRQVTVTGEPSRGGVVSGWCCALAEVKLSLLQARCLKEGEEREIVLLMGG